MFRFFLILLFGCLSGGWGRGASLAETAQLKYVAGDYAGALQDFQNCVEASGVSGELLYNMGNTYQRMKKPGEAVLHYRRALALAPGLAEAEQNLRFMERTVSFHSFEEASRWQRYRLPARTWWLVLCSSAWVVVIAAAWLALLAPRVGRRWPLVTLLCAAAVTVAVSGWFLAERHWAHAPLAQRMVVVSPDVTATTAPAEAASGIISLPPGSEVLPLQAVGNWTYLMIPAASERALRGWVRTSALQPLWPWAREMVE